MTTYYYPELGEKRPEAQIEARHGHYGKHWLLRTNLDLNGRGIELLGVDGPDDVCGPRAAELIGTRRYRVTEKAFAAIEAKYTVSIELLL